MESPAEKVYPARKSKSGSGGQVLEGRQVKRAMVIRPERLSLELTIGRSLLE
jgi:hypothetical protein